MTRQNLIAKIERKNPILYGIEGHLLGLDFPNQSINFDYSRSKKNSHTDCPSFNFKYRLLGVDNDKYQETD